MSETVSASTAQRTPAKPVARQATSGGLLPVSLWVQPSMAGPPPASCDPACSFVLSCVSGLEPPFPQEPVSETVLASRCWWHRWVVVADTNSASTLRSFRSEGCVRHELGVNPPLFPFGGLCRLLWRRQVAYQRRGAPVFGFFFSSSFPFFLSRRQPGSILTPPPRLTQGGMSMGRGGV